MNDSAVFFDTNTLVYANDTGSPEKRARARQLIRTAVVSGSGSISSQVLAEFWVTVTRKLKTPLSPESAREQIVLFSAFHVQPVDQATVLEAIRIQERYRISYWDAQIVASARFAKAEVVYSEDLQDGAEYDGVKIQNPFRQSEQG
ncbi:MAG: PIN domain-containing protein [Spirochaetia bacterium]